MPKLRTLSGPDVARIFSEFDFLIASQRGSHIKLRRVLPDGTRIDPGLALAFDERRHWYRNLEANNPPAMERCLLAWLLAN